MAEVAVEDRIDAPIEVVWDFVSDFVGFVEAQGLPVTGEGDGVGMTRTINMNGIEVVERLESCEPASHSLSYSIARSPLPLEDYLGTIRLHEDGPDRTRIQWTGRFQPPEGNDPAPMLEGIYRGGITFMQKHLGQHG